MPITPWRYETLAMRLARHFHAHDLADRPCVVELGSPSVLDPYSFEGAPVADVWVESGWTMANREHHRIPRIGMCAAANEHDAAATTTASASGVAIPEAARFEAALTEADGIAAVDAVKRRYEEVLRPRIVRLLQSVERLVDGSVLWARPWLEAGVVAIDQLREELVEISRRFAFAPTVATYAHVVRHNTLSPLGKALIVLQLKIDASETHAPWVAWFLPAFGETPRLLERLADAAMGPVRPEAVRRGITEESERLASVQFSAELTDAQVTALLGVFRNLATNGVVHGWEGLADEFDLSAAAAQHRYVRLSFVSDQLVYADNGQGIAPEVLAAVARGDWAAIRSRSEARGVGSGIGLEDFARVMNSLGWTWSIETPPNGGTRIVCTPKPEHLIRRPTLTP